MRAPHCDQAAFWGAFRRAACGLLTVALAWALPVHAADAPLEYRLKAAFLLNFAKLTQWPAARFKDAGDPLKLCVLGSDPFTGALEQTVAGKQIGGRPVTARRGAQAADLLDCHLVYLPAGERTRYAVAMKTLSGHSILTVDEGVQFSRPLGMIRFYLDQERVRFELNPRAVEQAQLKMDPKLSKIARIVAP